MQSDFTPQPHAEAVKLIAGKPAMTKRVFNQLLPELRARAFTVAGIEGCNTIQRIRDAVARPGMKRSARLFTNWKTIWAMARIIAPR
jgi:hypothetical protein